MSVFDLLPILNARRPDVLVVIISACGGADAVATALLRGADEIPHQAGGFLDARTGPHSGDD